MQNVKAFLESWKPSWIYQRVYEGVNYRLRTFAGGAWAARCRPVSIALLLTEPCNVRCVHCDIWKNRGKEDSHEDRLLCSALPMLQLQATAT
jgi:hypothetical protein